MSHFYFFKRILFSLLIFIINSEIIYAVRPSDHFPSQETLSKKEPKTVKRKVKKYPSSQRSQCRTFIKQHKDEIYSVSLIVISIALIASIAAIVYLLKKPQPTFTPDQLVQMINHNRRTKEAITARITDDIASDLSLRRILTDKILATLEKNAAASQILNTIMRKFLEENEGVDLVVQDKISRALSTDTLLKRTVDTYLTQHTLQHSGKI
jgi:uncharacterized membrane protein